MAFRFRDAADILRDNRIMVILGVVAATILLASRGQMQPKGNIPTEEPTISVCFHETGKSSHPLETYLEGVVAAEMDPTAPTLEAQAIVARTFTLKKPRKAPWGRNAQASTDLKNSSYDASGKRQVQR